MTVLPLTLSPLPNDLTTAYDRSAKPPRPHPRRTIPSMRSTRRAQPPAPKRPRKIGSHGFTPPRMSTGPVAIMSHQGQWARASRSGRSLHSRAPQPSRCARRAGKGKGKVGQSSRRRELPASPGRSGQPTALPATPPGRPEAAQQGGRGHFSACSFSAIAISRRIASPRDGTPGSRPRQWSTASAISSVRRRKTRRDKRTGRGIRQGYMLATIACKHKID